MSISPLQPKYYAFFDVDGTLLNIKTTHSFLRFYYASKYRYRLIGLGKYLLYILKVKFLEILKLNRNHLNVLYYKNFKGDNKKSLKKIIDNWFSSLSKDSLFISETLRELLIHQKNGAGIVLVSGSFVECLEPLARFLNVEAILATLLETKNNELTGTIMGQQVIGQGKKDVILTFLAEQRYSNLCRCFAYGDHISDVPMLEIVGNSAVVGQQKELIAVAKKNNWKILQQD